MAAFIRQERRTAHPLLDISVFADRRLSAGALSLTVMFALLSGMFLVMVQFLQAVVGFSALGSSGSVLAAGYRSDIAATADGLSPEIGRSVEAGSAGGLSAALRWIGRVR